MMDAKRLIGGGLILLLAVWAAWPGFQPMAQPRFVPPAAHGAGVV